MRVLTAATLAYAALVALVLAAVLVVALVYLVRIRLSLGAILASLERTNELTRGLAPTRCRSCKPRSRRRPPARCAPGRPSNALCRARSQPSASRCDTRRHEA